MAVSWWQIPKGLSQERLPVGTPMAGTHELVASNRQSSAGQLPADARRDTDGAQEPVGLTANEASLALLATVIGQIDEAILITNTSATIQYVNPAFTRMTGYSAEEVIGQNTRLLKSGHQDPAYYRKLWETIRAGQVWHGELLNRRRDGTHYIEEMSITPVRDPSGAIVNFVAIKQDVTEGRATKAALYSSEKRLEEVQHITPLGSWELDVETGEVRGSAGFFRIFDWAPAAAALPFRKMMDAIPDSDRQRVDKTIANTLQNREPFDVEHRVVRRDGTMRVVRNRGQVVAEQGGGSVRLVGTAHEITDFRLAHQKLRQSEEKFRSLVANIPDVTWSATADGRTDYISSNVERVFGFTPQEMYEPGANLRFGRIYTGDRQRIMTAVQQLFAEDQPFDVEYQAQRKDGEWIWIHDRAYRTYEKDGVHYADGVFSDITRRKRAEEAVRESEARYRLLFERNLAGVFRTTLEGRLLECNHAAARMLGYDSPEEILVFPIASLYHAASDREAFLTKLKSEKSLTNHEMKFRRKNGDSTWVIGNISLVDHDSGASGIVEGTIIDITERKRVEKELRMAQFSVEHASDAVRWVDAKGRIFYANEAACRALGRSREELLSLSVLDVDKLFFLKETWEAYWEELKARGAMTFESQNITKQGRVFPVEVTANYLEFDGKEYSFAFARDITERRRAEEVRERLAAVVESSDDAIISKTLNGIITAWNSGAEKLFGYSSAEAVGQSIEMLLPPERANEESEILARIRRGESVDHFETVRVRKDGRQIDMSATISPIKDSSGAIVGASKIARDITARKRAEEEARESSELVRLLLDSIPEAVYGIDTQGRCTFCNPCCLRLLGYREDVDLHGKNMHALMHHTREDGTPYPVEECHIYEAFRRGQGTHIDDEILWRRDGTSFSAEYWSHPLYRRGKVIGTVVTFVDITERKRVEQVLREAKEAAEDANRAKSQFLANMSHEIRTPMNGVIGVAGLLLDTELTPEQRQYAGIVRTSGEALLMVINDILDFSKIEARKLTLETTDFDLRTVLEDAVAVLAIKASEKGLALACEIEPGTPSLLRGDAGRVRQVLVNLLGNAVKFTAQGAVAASVRLEMGEECSATLRFTVTDTGVGFRQDRAAALFEPFVQADGSSTRRYGGTGLGLTISKQLVEMMGGRIGVESEEGKGSTFWFTAVFKRQSEKQLQPSVPMGAERSGVAGAAPVNPAVPRSGSVPAKRPARILLAEDNLTNQAVAKAMLSKLGYSADLVANGVEALHALRQADYDLVLMDCEMPEMDGYEATRRIRQRRAGTRTPHIPIIAITADAMSGDREKCLQAGMSDYLAKPVELPKLADVIEKWLQPPAGGEVSPPASQLPAKTEAVFNQEDLLARLMGDKGLVGQVIAGFLDDAPRQLRSLKKMLEEGDADGARRQAHTLKGAAATMSAEALRALCSEAQDAAESRELSRALALLPRLQEQFELLKTTLNQSGWDRQPSGGDHEYAHTNRRR
jgi:PAS domain S-box-containing protein